MQEGNTDLYVLLFIAAYKFTITCTHTLTYMYTKVEVCSSSFHLVLMTKTIQGSLYLIPPSQFSASILMPTNKFRQHKIGRKQGVKPLPEIFECKVCIAQCGWRPVSHPSLSLFGISSWEPRFPGLGLWIVRWAGIELK